jgi:hypothetical protein
MGAQRMKDASQRSKAKREKPKPPKKRTWSMSACTFTYKKD